MNRKSETLAIALLAASCGGQVEREAPRCHEVRGYFADARCSQRISFNWCEPPDVYFAIRDHQCTLVRP